MIRDRRMKEKSAFIYLPGVILMILVMTLGLQGCLGAAAGLAVGTAIEVAKIPFRVAGAAVGAVAETAGAIVGEKSGQEDE